MNAVVIIQARMGSSRLPGKVLKTLGNFNVLDYVVTRAKMIQGCSDVVIATTTKSEDDVICNWCKRKNVNYFRGSEENVLLRYYECAKKYKADLIVRITSDCPFVDFEAASHFVSSMVSRPDIDLLLLKEEFMLGVDVDIISFSALEFINNAAIEVRHKEHVTYYAFEYPEQFKTYEVTVPVYWSKNKKLRLTIDTGEDYQLCEAIATHFENNKLISTEAIIDFLLERPELSLINSHIQQKPVL